MNNKLQCPRCGALDGIVIAWGLDTLVRMMINVVTWPIAAFLDIIFFCGVIVEIHDKLCLSLIHRCLHCRAKFYVKRIRTDPRRSRVICKSCGYNLTGNVSGICPECGWELTRRPRRQVWAKQRLEKWIGKRK